MPYKVEDLAYMAGIVDGEGCISIVRYRVTNKVGYYYKIKLVIANTDEQLMRWIKNNFNGTVWKELRPEGQKNVWRWETQCQKAVPILKAILPYLVIKKEQAHLAIKLQSGISNKFGGKKPDIQEINRRERLKQKMHILNHKGDNYALPS